MNDLSKLTRQHYEKNEAGASLVSNVTKILDSLPAGSSTLRSLLAWTNFTSWLAATEQLAQIAGIERGTTILDAGSGLGGPSRYLREHLRLSGHRRGPFPVVCCRGTGARAKNRFGRPGHLPGR